MADDMSAAQEAIAVQEAMQQAGSPPANTLGVDIANLVLAELKADDGPCKYLLECVFSRAGHEQDPFNSQRHYLKAFYHMGKMYFSVQVLARGCTPGDICVVFPVADAALAWGVFSTPGDEHCMHPDKLALVYLLCTITSGKTTYKYNGHGVGDPREHGLSTYIALCENANVPNPVAVRSRHVRLVATRSMRDA